MFASLFQNSFASANAGNETFRVSSIFGVSTIQLLLHHLLVQIAASSVPSCLTSSSFSLPLMPYYYYFQQSDKRQFAGLLFGLSICATFFPMANLAGLVGPDGTTASEGVPLSSLIASVFVIAIGLTGMLTGYLSLVHDYGHKLLTGFGLVIVQAAWIPYITDMTNVGKMAATGAAFIPAVYNPTVSHVYAAGAFGILGVFSFGACFLGSLAFMMFSLYAYQSGKPGDRSASYFRGRLRVYSFLVFVAGVAQLSFGVLVLSQFGSGPLVPAPSAAMFTITYPEISIFVGLVYILNGMFGFYRATLGRPSADDHFFQYGMAFQYFCTVVLMIVVQIAYLPGGTLAGAAPSRSCLTLGAHVLPAFLDFKARCTPENLPENHYGLSGSGTTKTVEQDETSSRGDTTSGGNNPVGEMDYESQEIIA